MYHPSKRSRTGFAAIFILALAFCPLDAQTTLADPNDAIYDDLDAWDTKGLLKNLPRLRPYTQAMIIGLLKEVKASGSARDAAEAERYLDLLADKTGHVRADLRADAALSASGSSDSLLAAAPGLSVNTLIGDHLGVSARADAWLTQDVATDATYGDENMGVQAGFMRSSWGPIYDDGVVIGPQSPRSGQFTFSWRTPRLTMDAGLFMLRQGWSTSSGNLDSDGGPVGFDGGKYLMIHGIDWAPSPWLELGVYESMVMVDRLEPLYLIPLSEYFYSQSFSSYSDNSFAGISASVYLPQSMKLDLVAYADDLSFVGILKGDWDTKWKMAAQAALSWAPESPLIQRLSLDYTAVFPYMYTHWETAGTDSNGNSYNGALAYTNAGESIGAALDPNSDRVTLKAESRTIDGFQLTGLARLVRHGNASAGVNGYNSATSASGDASGDLGDSGVFDSSTNDGAWIFQGDYDTGTWPRYFRYLTQSVLQISAQAGIDLTYTRPIEGLGTANFDFGYLFEYIANDGCVSGVTGIKHYLSFSAGLQF
jgi:hypothetical protein